jgi:hypothetical protein
MGFLSDIMDKWFGFDPPQPPPLPPVPPPQPLPEIQDALSAFKGLRRGKKRGRGSTILTGELVPEDLGKRSLLG